MANKNLNSNNVALVLDLVGAKWKLLIIQELMGGEKRFSELKRKLGCTSKVLTSCLKEMEFDGFIVREIDSSKINKVDYYLTDIGFTLRPVIDEMQKWGKEYKKLQKLMAKLNKEST